MFLFAYLIDVVYIHTYYRIVGTPDGFNALRSVRSMLLDCCSPEGEEKVDGDEECHVIAPCTHNGTCPMVRHQKFFFRNKEDEKGSDEEEGSDENEIEEMDDDEIDVANDGENDGEKHKSFASETDVFDSAFCSFVHGMPGSTHRKQGEKFSYLVVQKRISDTSGNVVDDGQNHQFSGTNIVDLLKESLYIDANKEKRYTIANKDKSKTLLDAAMIIEDKFLESESDLLGLELVRGENRKSWGRIVRAPIKKKGHVIVDYCASVKDEEGEETGRIVRSKVTRSLSSRAAPGMYLSSRKARWGGFWPDVTEK